MTKIWKLEEMETIGSDCFQNAAAQGWKQFWKQYPPLKGGGYICFLNLVSHLLVPLFRLGRKEKADSFQACR